MNIHELDQTQINVLLSARQGDFADFVRIYVPLVYAFARGMALDENAVCDVAQAALLDLLRKMPHFQYDPTKQFRHFVRRIVYCRKVDYLRKRRECSLETVAERRGQLPEEVHELSDGNAYQEVSDSLLDLERQKACLKAALDEVRARVNPKTFQAFHLVEVQGESVEMAARILGQSPNQVSQNKHRVMERLRSKLEKLFGAFGE